MSDTNPKPTNQSAPVSSGKVFDVMRPGQAPADATSKPVIVGHKPMVDRSVSVNGVGEPQSLLDGRQKISIAPSPDAAKAADALAVQPPAALAGESPVTSHEPVQTTPVPSVGAPTVETDQANPNEPLLEAEAPAHAETPMSGSVVGPSPAQPAQTNSAPPQAVPSPAVTLDDLDDDTVAQTAAPVLDQVVVSHHRRGGSMWAVLLIILLIIVLAAVAVDLLLDAGVIKTSLNIPHTHLLK